MGLYTGFGFAGDFAGDFWLEDFTGLASPRVSSPADRRVPLFGRFGTLGGGGEGAASPSVSDPEESTIGFFRAAARGLPIPPQAERSEQLSAAL